ISAMMYSLSLILMIVLQPAGIMDCFGDWHRKSNCDPQEIKSHESWDALLQKYVDDEGNVDYLGFKKEESELDQYLAYLAQNAVVDEDSKEEKLVYYINLYNAATVKLILDNYPTGSIKDIKSPWDRKWIKVGEKVLSLGAIEHKILRKLNEPRIHFAINCASYSCPKLSNRAYSRDRLEEQLDAATSEFVNDAKRNRISKSGAEISQIFKWYKSDFTKNGSLVDYVNQYSKIDIDAATKVRYIKYDWSLNEAK
ncbi:MAG: DUF547 domain-containing protein, partial [Flavobacteriaceae bacterium]